MRLRELRQEHGYTQAEVAKQIGFTRSAYTNMELGIREITVETLGKLAALYGVTTDYLLGHEKKPTVVDDGLSEAERSLLSLFRKLPPDEQDAVIRIVQAASGK